VSTSTEVSDASTPSAQPEADRTAPSAALDPAQSRRKRGRRRFGLSIQSKLLIMLLAVSLLSSIVVSVIGYVNGRDSLRDAAFQQLTTIRELRTGAIEREFASLQQGVVLDSRNSSAVEGARAFINGFDKLQSSTISPAQTAKLATFYETDFVPKLEQRSGLDYATDAFIPASPAGRYIQSYYTAGRPYEDFDAGLALADAGDGSDWSKANAEYGPYFTGLVDTLGYEDTLIIDRNGNVAYSAYKSVDLGVNLREEPYASSSLTKSYQQVLRNGSLDEVVTTDFERYLPSLNVPTAWVMSPIGSATDIIGVLAVQVPITQINAVMTGDKKWEQQGLGQTGEVYLAGSDKLMRSTSRLLEEHPDEYAKTVVEYGTPASTADRIVAVKGTVQLQPVPYLGVNEALAGRTGVALAPDYTNSDSLVAYAPLEIKGLDWVIVAHIDAAEAFAPVTAFTRGVLLSLLGIVLVVSLLSLLLAQVFTRPINRLVSAVRRVAGGDLAVEVPQGSRDEIGDLGTAFNDMASSLRVKQELIDVQTVENEKLMHTLMPESMAKRYKEGEESISEQHDNVAVVFAELVGFDAYARKLSGDEEIVQLNHLMRGFDEAAEKTGVEKVRTLRGGYLASSGLVVPRVDNVRRAVDFARELRTVIDRFNTQHGSSIELRAGVDSGTVTSGLVARTNLAYDLWGDAVSLAYRVRNVGGQSGVFVSQSVRDRLAETADFVEAGSVELQGKTQPVWRLASA
jgi:class 3 adenylate cyclase